MNNDINELKLLTYKEVFGPIISLNPDRLAKKNENIPADILFNLFYYQNEKSVSENNNEIQYFKTALTDGIIDDYNNTSFNNYSPIEKEISPAMRQRVKNYIHYSDFPDKSEQFQKMISLAVYNELKETHQKITDELYNTKNIKKAIDTYCYNLLSYLETAQRNPAIIAKPYTTNKHIKQNGSAYNQKGLDNCARQLQIGAYLEELLKYSFLERHCDLGLFYSAVDQEHGETLCHCEIKTDIASENTGNFFVEIGECYTEHEDDPSKYMKINFYSQKKEKYYSANLVPSGILKKDNTDILIYVFPKNNHIDIHKGKDFYLNDWDILFIKKADLVKEYENFKKEYPDIGIRFDKNKNINWGFTTRDFGEHIGSVGLLFNKDYLRSLSIVKDLDEFINQYIRPEFSITENHFLCKYDKAEKNAINKFLNLFHEKSLETQLKIKSRYKGFVNEIDKKSHLRADKMID